MANYSISIPRDILDEKIALGLTFEEIIILLSGPLVLILPALFIRRIPLWLIFITVFVGFVFVGAVIVAAPKGQSPVQWFPKHINRRVNPDSFKLKPRDSTEFGKPNVVYRDVVRTAPMLEKEYETKKPNEELIRQYIKDIEYAEKLEVPDKVDAVVAVNDEVGMLSSNEFLEDDDKEDTTEQDPETQDSMDADFAVPDGEAPVPSVENELTDPFAGDVNAEPVAADSSETDGDIVDSGETKDSDSQSVITQIITSVKGIRNNKNKNNGE